jgi:large subunit ribosomal protein L17
VLHESITTTEAKAKEVAPHFERLVTKAKKGDLANSRALRAFLLTENAVQKMLQELAPAFGERNGGYTRIIKAGNRRGDNAPMAVLSLVLPEKVEKPVETKTDEPKAEKKTEEKPKVTSKAEPKEKAAK